MPIVDATRAKVKIGGAVLGSMNALAVQASTGGREMVARIAYMPNIQPVYGRALLSKTEMQGEFKNDICEIRLGNRLIHYGRIVGFEWEVGPRGETMVLTSRTDPHMFGQPLEGVTYYDPNYHTTCYVREDHVFNPLVDGRVVPNMVLSRQLPFFVHPDLVNKNEFFPRQPWTLGKAVEYLLFNLNSRQTHFQNPNVFDYALLDNTVPLNNVRLSFGTPLVECLNQVIEPMGYAWSPTFINDRPGFRFWKRGTAAAMTTSFPAYGSTGSDNDAIQAVLACDLVDGAVNSVTVIGARPQIESTFTLYPGWDPALETNRSAADLIPGSDFLRADPKHEWLYREYFVNANFVGNRRGYWRNPDTGRVELIPFFDISKLLFNDNRRHDIPYRFLPCITLGADGRPAGEHNGYHLEMQKANGDWMVFTEQFRILESECGIRITEAHLPRHLTKPLKLRITCSVQGHKPIDFGLTAPWSSLQDTVPLFLDKSTNFFHRKVSADSIFFTEVASGQRDTAEVDDRPAMEAYARQVLGNFSRPTIKGPIVRPQIVDDPMRHLGQSVKVISGRNISLNCTNAFFQNMAPDIIGFQLDFQRQTSTFQLDRVPG